jgi:DNA-binding NtrC family response regulator
MEKCKIFVIEDNKTEAMVMKLAFNGISDIEISYFYEGRTLFEALKTTVPQVIITDLILTDMHGLDLVHNVLEKHPKVRFIVVSAQESMDMVAKLQQEGIFNYVVKSESCLRYLRNVLKDLLIVLSHEKSIVA